MRRSIRSTFCSLLLLVGCGGEETGAKAELPYETLSEYRFFVGPLAEMRPAPGVIPYVVAAPLWADHAGKDRFFVLPEGTRVEVDGEDWAFPVGSVVVKSFFYSRDLRSPGASATVVETRLLIREADGWSAHTYVWDDAQTEAVRKVAGTRKTLAYLDETGGEVTGTYVVPNTNQCADCHERDDELGLLGPVTSQMARRVERGGVEVDQLGWLAEQGLFDEPPVASAPLVDPFGDAPLDQRARSYLAGNCAHCHRAGGHGGPSGLVLEATETRPAHFGICKSPVAAGPGSGGRLYDITPGRPDESIMVYRMESTDLEVKMPELPNLIPDDAGARLIREWIAAMDPPGCDGD